MKVDEFATLVAIGTMSGTSLDGIDAAIIESDGRDIIRTSSALHRPYSRELKDLIRGAISAALSGSLEKGMRDAAEIAVTDAHAEAVVALLAEAGGAGPAIDVIGLHGQTILHRPAGPTNPVGETVQLGDGARLADATGIDVVNDFRSADVHAGGEGAPFAPAYHRALVASWRDGTAGDVGVINLGGVANITYVPKQARDVDLVAFDCGPGNGLIDEWVELQTGAAYDRDGELARAGRV
ncbi:MAG: anhydro-N-acetylmuramic acid kinase, partial [Myxococcota bacterium]